MKVYIGNYPKHLQCKIHDNYMNKRYGYNSWPAQYTRFESLLEKCEAIIQSVYDVANRVYFHKQEQTQYVKIDRHDTWSMDYTLAPIILPMLMQLKDTKHGAPFVDDEDVPESIQSINAEPKENEWDVDSNHFKRWDHVLDEMIFAFARKLKDDVWELEENERQLTQERMTNGFRLFGKYYENLWD